VCCVTIVHSFAHISCRSLMPRIDRTNQRRRHEVGLQVNSDSIRVDGMPVLDNGTLGDCRSKPTRDGSGALATGRIGCGNMREVCNGLCY
jgi:hypothetical protein